MKTTFEDLQGKLRRRNLRAETRLAEAQPVRRCKDANNHEGRLSGVLQRSGGVMAKAAGHAVMRLLLMVGAFHRADQHS